jgi:hypothetical protein
MPSPLQVSSPHGTVSTGISIMSKTLAIGALLCALSVGAFAQGPAPAAPPAPGAIAAHDHAGPQLRRHAHRHHHHHRHHRHHHGHHAHQQTPASGGR